MELYQYILIALGAILLIAIVITINNKRKVTKKEYELPVIFGLLDKNNIESVEFNRNKIVICFKDVTLFDTKTLLDNGAKGISVVGDKVKFYFDGDEILNKSIFEKIKNYLER